MDYLNGLHHLAERPNPISTKIPIILSIRGIRYQEYLCGQYLTLPAGGPEAFRLRCGLQRESAQSYPRRARQGRHRQEPDRWIRYTRLVA